MDRGSLPGVENFIFHFPLFSISHFSFPISYFLISHRSFSDLAFLLSEFYLSGVDSLSLPMENGGFNCVFPLTWRLKSTLTVEIRWLN